jgi:hypothetical protein
MSENSHIKFNPVTKEIEIEGSETFIKIYFDKLQEMISGTPEVVVKEPKAQKVSAAKKGEKKPKAITVIHHPKVGGGLR